MDFEYKFQKIDKIVSFDFKSVEDLDVLVDSIINDPNCAVHNSLSSKEKDLEIVDDLIHLIEEIKERSVKNLNHKYKDLIYLIVSTCLSQNYETPSSHLIQRLYKRGFSTNLSDSFVKFYCNLVKENEPEEFEYSSCLGKSDSSLLLCCTVLKYLSKFLYVDQCEGEFFICIDSYVYYNVVRRTISLMFGSYLNYGNCWNFNALSNLFHPLSRTNLPCLILYLIIDLIPEVVKIELLEQLSSYYSDYELMRTLHINQITQLSGCISRLLHNTFVSCTKACVGKSISNTLSALLTKGITSGLSTLDPIIRLSTIIVAESYSEFLYNNTFVKDESALLKFDQEYKEHMPNTYQLAAYKSSIIVNPNFSNIKMNLSDVSNLSDNINKQSDDDNRPSDNGERQTDSVENEAFLKLVFKETPSINAQTVKGYVKELYLKPPQHIVQCYERLLSNPARGDIDYECLNTQPLDRQEDESVENKILRISQALLYLPQIIKKNEKMLERYSIPISELLLKLDDLDLYREKIEEIVNKTERKLVDESSNKDNELGVNLEFVSKEPEKLILVSLALMTYQCPLHLSAFFTSHLFDNDFTLSIRISMLLCIQYTAIAFNKAIDIDTLTNKILNDTSQISNKTTRFELTSVNKELIGKSGVNTNNITLVPGCYPEINPSNFTLSKNFVKNFNNECANLLMSSLSSFSRKKESERFPMEEDIVVGILETLIILVTTVSEEHILNDLKEMSSYFNTSTTGQRLKNTLEFLSMVLETNENQISN
ncbi:hypothetical protein TpMuguga_02g00020 [Theileria parva strain Muguga]|uniref:Uncharacterized protein n=1 Tax=Theileria parva TaxID=5875 RepID=Q4N6B7_THEPA|nr:uncharacterized protein TpMuguga_02g00020 [Theileria parva strain Muguga]EAN32306.1 hypothetical protein TpMuguga_02g00020 [Theileria parva strain Muguga]|eukprot:XP_764589.1 hypothetical protein [Theileria parva strain Muguga]